MWDVSKKVSFVFVQSSVQYLQYIILSLFSACCKLQFLVEGESTTEVMNKLNATIGSKGPDGLYTPMPTAEGTMTFGDLRPYDKTVDFIGQAW